MMQQKFKVGDTVRLLNGTKPMIVIAVSCDGQRVGASYLGRSRTMYPSANLTRHASGFVLIKSADEDVSDTGENTMPKSGQLYSTKTETVLYGTYMCTDSKGRYVLEMKSGGEPVLAFMPDDVEKIAPYTVKVVAVNAENRGYSAHYALSEGSVVVDDLLLSDSGHLYRVKQLDTKFETPKTWSGVKLAATPLS